jgi:hypothetical protein
MRGYLANHISQRIFVGLLFCGTNADAVIVFAGVANVVPIFAPGNEAGAN